LRYNASAHTIEVNGKQMDEGIQAEIHVKMRERGVRNMDALKDVIVYEAYQNRYHPVQACLTQALLQYDGTDHIAALAGYVTDSDGMFSIWLRKWLIGATAKILKAEQNPMLVMDGAQGIGKSEFARWLCPLLDYFIEASIAPDDKDTYLRLASKWVWEVAELGATIRKTDREALKHFISMRQVTVRPAYARHDLIAPAMASLIGTVNNEVGILNDPTGSRRFLICHVTHIDWNYREQIDRMQVWGGAYAAYLRGESWHLSSAEALAAQAINARYEVDDAIEGLLKRYFTIDANRLDSWFATDEILEILYGLQGVTRQNSIALGACMKRLGPERMRRKNKKGQKVWGFAGIVL